ncbi:MAG: DUF3997 domain-containing protein [Colwellia sp.]|nr:DUF3997 domain-containing protein [Colwellia sp.]
MIIRLVFLVLLATGCSDEINRLPGGFKFIYEGPSNSIIIHESDESLIIPCSISDYKFDTEYIFIKQKKEKECFWVSSDTHLQKVGRYYYWVIEIDTKEIIGPLTKENFINLQNRLSTHLVLK